MGWWVLSVAGQCCDIVGFAVITLDVWPEYRLSRWERRSEPLHRGLAYVACQELEADGTRQLLRDVLDRPQALELERLRSWLGLPLLTSTRAGSLEPDVEASRQEVADALSRKRHQLEARWRPPVGWGAFLVILGFACQVAGSLPFDNDPAALLRSLRAAGR